MTSAASEALGPETELRVEPAPDPDGMRLADVGKANAVVRLTWDEAEHRRARILCYFRKSQRWVDREVVFDASDPERERGRTLGFLVASMLINANSPAGDSTEPDEPRSPSREAPRDNAVTENGARAPQQLPSTTLVAAAELASAGAATGYGFWLGAERAIFRQALWFGGSAHARFGFIDKAEANSRLLGLGLHLNWVTVRAGPLWLGARVGGSLAQLSATRLVGDATESQNRVLPSAEILAHTGYRFSAGSALSAQLGGEFLSGVTRISVGENEVATWPWAALVVRAGIESAF